MSATKSVKPVVLTKAQREISESLDTLEGAELVKVSVSLWKKTLGDGTQFILAKAAYLACTTGEHSTRSFGDLCGKGKSMVDNYVGGFRLAQSYWTGEPTVRAVATATNFKGNASKATREAFEAMFKDDAEGARVALDTLTVKEITELVKPEPVKPEDSEPEESEETEPAIEETVDNFAGLLGNLEALIADVIAGKYTAEQSAKFHRAGVDLQRAAEGAIARTAKGAVKASK